MRQSLLLLAGIFLTAILFISCQQDNAAAPSNEVSAQVLDQIRLLGYSTENVQKIEEGYLVEGDMILTDEDLNDHGDHLILRIAETEQYRTTNVVSVNGSRTITVSMDATLVSTAGYSAALDTTIARYNARNLNLTFQRVSSGGNVHYKKQGGNFLASAGFPTSSGNPYNLIKLNSGAIGNGNTQTFIKYCATIMAHELGHCIGFRHTDYMDRSYSCGGSYYNEGQAGVGAMHLPGTPTGPDALSWMLSCIGNGNNRPFNANDVTALNAIY